MIQVTDRDRWQVLMEYRRRRRFRGATPHETMRAVMTCYAAVQMLILTEGGRVDRNMVARWAAARTYETAMLRQGGRWVEHRR
jgi:hypothetical protein